MTLAIHHNVVLALGGVFAILVLSSVAVFALRRARPHADWTELSRRVRSWWIMVLVFAVAMALHRNISLAFFFAASLLAFREYLSLLPLRPVDRSVVLWAYVAIPLQYVWIAQEWYGMFVVWIPVYVFLFLPLRMVLIGETKGFVRAAGTLQWGLMVTVFSVSHVAYLLVLPEGEADYGGGAALVLFLVFLTQFNDVAQFVWGKLFGRHPVVPRVSPKKTVQGLLGGLVTTVLLAWLLAPWLTPLDTPESLIAGVMIGLAGFVGDVVMSAVKRDVGTKDSGTLLPGHGGILDRLDSLTYTAPLFFHFVHYTHF